VEKIAKVMIGQEVFEIDIEKTVGIEENLVKEMDRISSQIAFYGKLLAEAMKEKIILDSLYRKWRAKVAMKTVRDDPKISEWKVKASIEEQDQFVTFKQAEGQCEYNVVALNNIIDGLKEKSQNLRSKGANLRIDLLSNEGNNHIG
jgi:hypothetical protein